MAILVCLLVQATLNKFLPSFRPQRPLAIVTFATFAEAQHFTWQPLPLQQPPDMQRHKPVPKFRTALALRLSPPSSGSTVSHTAAHYKAGCFGAAPHVSPNLDE